ncbi:MAG: cytidine deaminase [Acidimicrobiia bacterium]|nr:cytidine deaminase [Acidimicrobiia bacterium]NNL26881.1 cytidine deaminase [Acidimicrobiia bacterium]
MLCSNRLELAHMDAPSIEEASELLNRARTVAERAYAPYSNFRVGAIAVTDSGEQFEGANVENAAYPTGLCAEASATGAAITSGARRIPVMAVISLDAVGVVPCGQCRQRMVEFGVEWIVLESEDEPEIVTLQDLLPRSFEYWE